MSEKAKNALFLAKERGYKSDANGNIKKTMLPLKGTIINGYRNFSVRVGKTIIHIPFHRFIMFELYGDEIFFFDCVRHLDGNSLNNTYSNLKLGTFSDNAMDIPVKSRRARSSKANLKHDHYKIIKMSEEGLSYLKIMQATGIKSKGTISFIINKSLQNEQIA